MTSAKLYDEKEFARFIASGVCSTIGNLLTVLAVAEFASYWVALLCGIATAASISFLLTKVFVFGSKSWSKGAVSEGGRFAVVYFTGCLLYFLTALLVENLLSGYDLSLKLVQIAGVIVGAGVMVVTSYFGHRFFTY